jgi:ABC-type bacteriocin/lantibiotic exporter with double-glycine peptidase domain
MDTEISRMPSKKARRASTPTVLQMEAVECGAAALGSILAYYGCNVPLEALRRDCGVSRDGSRADNISKAAKKYGLVGKFYKKEPAALFETVKMPVIVFWNFYHFVVVEGYSRGKVYINDPANGPRTVSWEEFDEAFTGVAMHFEPGENFEKKGALLSDFKRIARRLKGLEDGLIFAVIATLFLVVPGLAVPVFLRVFVDKILVKQLYGWIPPLLIGMGITMIVSSILTWMQQYYLLRTQTKMALKNSGVFMWHILRLPIQFFSQRYAAEITQRSQLNDMLANIFSGQLATASLNVIMVFFYGVILFLYSWQLALIGIITVMANFAFLWKMSRSRRDTCLKMMQEKGKMTATTMAALQMVETIKAQASEDEVFNYWAGFQAKAASCSQKLGRTVQHMTVMPQFLMMANRFVILCAGALLIMRGMMTVGELVAFQM